MGEYNEGTIVAGGNGQGNQLNQLNGPSSISVSEDQSVYVSDWANHRVMKWRKDAKEGKVVAGGNGYGRNLNQLSNPRGVIVDYFGQIYVADWGNDGIMRWCEGKEEGEVVVGGNGKGSQSNSPNGLSFDDEGNLYVADSWNNRIQKFEIVLNVRIQTELTAIKRDNEAENYRRYKRTKNVEIQAAFTDITLDDNVTNERQQARNPRAKVKNDSAHKLDGADERQTMRLEEDSNIDRNRSNQQNRRNTKNVNKDIIKSDDTELSPILGYSEEPLLPLAQACAPMNDIFYNLSFYVQLALKETPEQPPDGLSFDESAAIRLHTIEWDKPHRSLYSTLNFNLKNNDRQALLPFHSEEFPPGSAMTWWAFSSCTTEMTVLENNMYLGQEGDRTLFSVEAINGRTIKAHSHFVTED
ncbi:unnamed protein product [Adineta steineri]|nr:unnamed protein product [Adineta steineri]